MNDITLDAQASDTNGADGPDQAERKGFDEPKVEQQGDLPVITAAISFTNHVTEI